VGLAYAAIPTHRAENQTPAQTKVGPVQRTRGFILMFNIYDGFPSDEFFAVLLDCMANSSHHMVAYLLGDGQ
jgi:hypothetical protein